MSLVEWLQLALTAGFSIGGGYVGVRTGLAEVKQIALGARAEAVRANDRIDEVLLRRKA